GRRRRRDQSVRDIDDRLPRPIVDREWIDLRIRRFDESRDIGCLSTGKTENRLIVIGENANRLRVCRESTNNSGLNRVGVLELVSEDVSILPGVSLDDRFLLGEESRDQHYQVVKVDDAICRL